MKLFCVLQVAAERANWEHIKLFANHPESDFFFVTWKKEHGAAMAFCPNTSWAETRNKLVELVPKDYEYYAFVDEDYILGTHTNLNARQQIAADLELHKPAVLVPYPGKGNATPLVADEKYRQSVDYSIQLFTHCGLKIVHRSLLPWFFPMLTEFDGWWSASHFWNIQEIPLMDDIVVSHRLTYQNGANSTDADNRKINKRLNMARMWNWLRPYYNHRHILRPDWTKRGVPKQINEHATATDPMAIKKHHVAHCAALNAGGFASVRRHKKQRDFYDIHRFAEHFDLPLTRTRTRPLVVMGNGPSFEPRFFDIIKDHGLDSIGMNGSYRRYKDMNWWPNYFCSFDYAVTAAHAEAWGKMILDRTVPIEKYFLLERPSIEAKLGNTRPYFPEEIRQHRKFVEVPHNQDGIGWPEYGTKGNNISCTGANAVRVGAMLGYKDIILVGCDCRYTTIEARGGAKAETKQRYVVTEKREDVADYWDGEYLQPGDLLHQPGDHRPAWRRLGALLKKYAPDVNVANCSLGSRIDCFRFSTLPVEARRND